MKHRLFVLLISGSSIIALASLMWMVRPNDTLAGIGVGVTSEATAQIHGKVFKLDIAATPSARERGLSNTDFLPEDRGMLFLYDKPDYYAFWMKDMRFPLDIIYIRGSTIVAIARNLPPPTQDSSPPSTVPLQLTDNVLEINSDPLSTLPLQSADKVLEINAGLCDRYNINVGDAVRITLAKEFKK